MCRLQVMLGAFKLESVRVCNGAASLYTEQSIVGFMIVLVCVVGVVSGQ